MTPDTSNRSIGGHLYVILIGKTLPCLSKFISSIHKKRAFWSLISGLCLWYTIKYLSSSGIYIIPLCPDRLPVSRHRCQVYLYRFQTVRGVSLRWHSLHGMFRFASCLQTKKSNIYFLF